MMTLLDGLSILLIAIGCFFFVAGSIGMLRFPDVFCRLHATTKADNVGLGLVTTGLLLQVDSPHVAGKLILIWLLALLAAATSCHLIAKSALQKGTQPWSKP